MDAGWNRGGRGRPLVAVAAVAAARVAAPGQGWRAGQDQRLLPAPARPGAFLPGKGVGVPFPEQTWSPRPRSLLSRAVKTHG